MPRDPASPALVEAVLPCNGALVQRIHDVFRQAMQAPAHVEALAKYDQELL